MGTNKIGTSDEMRVLHIGKFFPPVCGGIENFAFDLTRAHEKEGITPFVLAHQAEPFRPTSWETFGQTQVCRVSILGNLIYAPLAPTYPSALRTILRTFSPDVIHVHLPNLSAFCLLLIRRHSPVVIHWHADVVASRIDRRLAQAYRFYRPFEKQLLRKASAVIGTSEPYLKSSLPLQDFMSKCHVVPLGLDPSRLHGRSSEKSNLLREKRGNSLLVLSAGRFTYYKGFEFLTESVRDIPEVRLVIVGEGPLRRKISERIKRLGMENRVCLPGEVSNEELHSLMAACDVFCLPSIERTEAFGLVLLETMAFGKPLITTDIKGSGVNWVNRHGETGLVVKTGDSEALTEAIRFFLEHPRTRHEMGIEARKRFDELFHIRKVSREIRTLYSTLQTPP